MLLTDDATMTYLQEEFQKARFSAQVAQAEIDAAKSRLNEASSKAAHLVEAIAAYNDTFRPTQVKQTRRRGKTS